MNALYLVHWTGFHEKESTWEREDQVNEDQPESVKLFWKNRNQPETVQPETVQPETVQHETVQPETVQPETVQPETV